MTISAARAFEIIALNKQGIRVDALDPDSDDTPESEYGDIIGQDSLTRFDKNRKKKKKKRKPGDPSEQTPVERIQKKPQVNSRPDKPAADYTNRIRGKKGNGNSHNNGNFVPKK